MSRPAVPLDEVLEALGLPRADPGIGYLERLFLGFNERVPFETASKIVRDAEIADPREKPRWPDVFWRDHIENGMGGTCFARVAAFDHLLCRLGFPSRKVLGRVESDFDHAAVLVKIGGEEWVCDVGFPLPALLRAVEGEVETALMGLHLERTNRGFRVAFSGGVPEGPRGIEIFTAPVTEEEFTERWRKTFRRDSRFLTSVGLRRQRQGRVVSFAAGEVRVDDLHSRTRIPILGSRPPLLAELFDVDASLLTRAFSIAGDPAPGIPTAQVSVYLETDATPEAAFAAIASPESYGHLMEGVSRVAVEASSGGRWRVRLNAPGATGDAGEQGSLEEEVEPDPAALTLKILRGSQESSYQADSRRERTYLVRRAILSGPGDDLLRNDSLRGRLAGTLALDLLAWARFLARGREGVPMRP